MTTELSTGWAHIDIWDSACLFHSLHSLHLTSPSAVKKLHSFMNHCPSESEVV